jgi:hypothetical protein
MKITGLFLGVSGIGFFFGKISGSADGGLWCGGERYPDAEIPLFSRKMTGSADRR